MHYVIVGLGNPGAKYEKTRHNAGRLVLEHLHAENDFSEWRKDGVARALVSRGVVEGADVVLVLPETFMNESGKSLGPFVTREKSEEALVVVYDDLDLPIGTIKMSFGRGTGGHRGVASVIASLGTKNFTRIRVGISPKTFFGNIKKPKGEERVSAFILGTFSGGEMRKVKELSHTANKMIHALIKKGREYAMSHYN